MKITILRIFKIFHAFPTNLSITIKALNFIATSIFLNENIAISTLFKAKFVCPFFNCKISGFLFLTCFSFYNINYN